MKILLVEWDRKSAAARAERLRAAGHEVLVESDDGALAYRTARAEKPDVVLLDLRVKAAHSRQTARPLVGVKDPPRLVFLDGADDQRERAAAIAPDAVFTTGDRLDETLDRLG